jgi:hypothetical protein
VAVTVTTYPDLNATGYISVAELTAWADQWLKDISGKSPDQLALAINTATEYMDTRFLFVGYRKDADQALEWPRSSAYNSRGDQVAGIPLAVKAACSGYAFMALSTELMPAPVNDGSNRTIKSKDEKVGPISESVEYDIASGYEMPVYPSIDRLLSRHGLILVKPSIFTGSVGRA